MAAEAVTQSVDLVQVVGLLAAGVVAVPIFRRLGLGSVLGYLAAGLAIGPFGLRLVTDPQAILAAAQFGVVMFLFIIGLEMEPSRLWNLRKQIFGVGLIQVLAAGLVLTGLGCAFGFSPPVAFVAGMGFVLTSTAIVIQLLEERGELASAGGQKIVSILLLEDLSIVPLLAIVALLAPYGAQGTIESRVIGIGIALGAVLAIVAVGRWILNPLFRILANAKAREVMTAAALLVVLGAALIMQLGGLSMATGAFLAGVLLSTSTFRHQLEADVEPFRGLLLGLFFLAVGMSLDLNVVVENAAIIAICVVGYKLAKGAVVYGVARVMGADSRMAIERGVLMAQGGEFAFVLYSTAASIGVIDAPHSAIFSAVVILSMLLTPFTVMGLKFLPKPKPSLEGVELPDGLDERILVIGFGRFGQIAVQPLLAQGHRMSIIDNDTDMIRVAGRFGRKVYYGDGRRLDVLQAAGAGDRRRGADLRRRQGGGDANCRTGAVRIPARQGDVARLRPRACHRADQGRRRLPAARDVGIGGGVRRRGDPHAGRHRRAGRQRRATGPRLRRPPFRAAGAQRRRSRPPAADHQRRRAGARARRAAAAGRGGGRGDERARLSGPRPFLRKPLNRCRGMQQ